MSRTVSSDRQTLVPSFPLLPLERLAYSIATKRSLSREFFNGIGHEPSFASLPESGPSTAHSITSRIILI
jgi:hypothetical protein